jgi:hypothetical protein
VGKGESDKGDFMGLSIAVLPFIAVLPENRYLGFPSYYHSMTLPLERIVDIQASVGMRLPLGRIVEGRNPPTKTITGAVGAAGNGTFL